ncbi:MAG: hypothetical protein Q8P18_11335 [Pseudomonadota bacterium]|nr:hypothetical protein [Pseudomonadota bacterium]
MLVSVLVAALLAGCAADCTTATCLADAAIKDWPTDQIGVTARIIALPDDLTRTVVVGRLGEAFPGRTAALCRSLPDELSRQRCQRLNDRPHLAFDPGAHAVVGAQAAASGGVPADEGPLGARPAGPRLAGLPEDRLPLPPSRGSTPVPVSTCSDAPDRSACLDETALHVAIEGDAARASDTCSLHAELRWADECRFNAAEQSVRERHGDAYRGAAALCGAATTFTQECLVHVLTRVPKRVLPLDAGPERVKSVIHDAEAIRSAWLEVDEAVADRHVDRFWALYFANVYREAEAPDGTPLAWYPEAAWPHVRAAAATRLRSLGRLSGPLATQLAHLEQILAARRDPGSRRGRPPDLVYVEDLGSPAAEGPSAFFLGASRRALGADARTDLVFCLLESAGRAKPADTALLDEASVHPDARIRAEARRIRDAIAGGSGATPP